LLKAIELRPDYPGSYNLLGFVSLVTGNNIDETMTLLTRALKAAPGRNELVFHAGPALRTKDDYKTARLLLEQVTKSAADEELRQHAETVLKQLVAMQEQIDRYEQTRKRGFSGKHYWS